MLLKLYSPVKHLTSAFPQTHRSGVRVSNVDKLSEFKALIQEYIILKHSPKLNCFKLRVHFEWSIYNSKLLEHDQSQLSI